MKLDLLEKHRELSRRESELDEELEEVRDARKAIERLIEFYDLDAEPQISVKNAAKEIGQMLGAEKFSSTDVMEAARAMYPHLKETHRATWSAAVKSLADQGVFVLLEEGAGSRPAYYGNPEHHEQPRKEDESSNDEKKNEDEEPTAK